MGNLLTGIILMCGVTCMSNQSFILVFNTFNNIVE